MLRPRILICGKNLIKNKTLLAALQEKYQVGLIGNYLNVEASLIEKVNLVIVEFLNRTPENLQFLRTVKITNPRIIIIVVVANGNIESTSEFFYAGASDIFPKPIHYSLLTERIEALLKTSMVT